MSKLLRAIRVLIREIRRRKVTGVVVAYTVFAGGTIQLADIVAPRMDLPENTVSVLILLALVGLPVVALLAWLYDVVPDTGIPAAVTTPTAEAEERPPLWKNTTLPTAAGTPFIGRAEELRTLSALLTGGRARLVTLTGPGGVGKTRLAIETAHAVAKTFADGVVFRPLSALTSADVLVPAIAESLGLPLTRRDDPLAELQSFLADKQLLLVLDNFEHIMGGAGVVGSLLDHAPELRMLVTSRERLNLQHETLVTLDGFRVHDDPTASHAVQLFVAGARRLDRRFELNPANQGDVERICTLVDGIPLAIELASAWVRTLSCAEIRAELERGLDILATDASDIEARHHSLRATFDSSWNLLTPAEQSALARLAVFRSEFDGAAAAEVADAHAPVLRQLVDKSLLTRSDEQLLLLDVIRAYAHERLREDPAVERAAYERHLGYFSALLQSLHDPVQRAEPAAIARIAGAIDEVRAAWNYALQTNNVPAVRRSLDPLFHFYEARGWAREGADMFSRARTAIGDGEIGMDVPRTVRLAAAQLDVRHGVFLHRLGELREAESLLRRGAAVLRELDEQAEIAFALHRLGAVRHAMGDYADAERLHEEGWQLARDIGDQHAVGWSMTYLGNVAWSRGELDRATQLYAEAMTILRDERDLSGMWVTVNNLGVIAASRGQYTEAQHRFREGLALQEQLNNPRMKANVLHNLGCAAREAGDHARARKWLQESLEISERMGYQSMAGLTLVGIAELEIRDRNDSAGAAALQRALRSAAAARNQPLSLEALLTLARLRLRQGDARGAAELVAVTAHHPSGDDDLRRKSAELLAEIGLPLAIPERTPDLAAVIDRVVQEGAAPPRTGARRHNFTHAPSAGEP
jgi:predicted ATPase/Tfp pilus assembly protein PilF